MHRQEHNMLSVYVPLSGRKPKITTLLSALDTFCTHYTLSTDYIFYALTASLHAYCTKSTLHATLPSLATLNTLF